MFPCCINRRMPAVFMAFALVGMFGPKGMAGPLFPHPFGTLPPGFVPHLLPIGPVPMPPGTVLGPIFFGDGVVNAADPHHWELEIHNPAGGGIFANDVLITSPSGIVAFGGLTLMPGESAYWHITYADVPEVGGLYALTAASPATAPFFLFDSSVVEYNFPLVGPPPAGPLFLGPPGGLFGPLLGTPIIRIDLSLVPIPEPTTNLGFAFVAVLCLWKARKRLVRGRRRDVPSDGV